MQIAEFQKNGWRVKKLGLNEMLELLFQFVECSKLQVNFVFFIMMWNTVADIWILFSLLQIITYLVF